MRKPLKNKPKKKGMRQWSSEPNEKMRGIYFCGRFNSNQMCFILGKMAVSRCVLPKE